MGKSNNCKECKQTIFGYLSAIRTMLDNYPQLKTSDELEELLGANTPFGFLMSLLRICGIGTERLMNWISKILCGREVLMAEASKATDFLTEGTSKMDDYEAEGLLDAIEGVIKALLLTNVKNLFTCSLNPFIPKSVMKSMSDVNGPEKINGEGIKIPLTTIDMFNIFKHAPNDERYGNMLYFDADYKTNELWKSTDFNAFLWYVINRGTNIYPDNYKRLWDNRVRWRRQLRTNRIFQKNFFNIYYGDGSFVNMKNESLVNSGYPNASYKKDYKAATSAKKRSKQTQSQQQKQKKQYIYVEYNEQDVLSMPSCLTIWLNADRYCYRVGKGNLSILMPKTVFEFNWDYVTHLKLFDSKVIVGSVINALLGIGNNALGAVLGGKYSIQQQLIAGQVGEVVRKLMNGETTTIDDSFCSFSNDDYNSLMEETKLKQYNQYKFGNVSGTLTDEDIQGIKDSINNIGNASTLEEVQTNIENTFNGVANVIAASSESVNMTDQFSFGQNILTKIIEECVIQIVLQLLTPKVMLLFAINSYFMGDVTDGDFSKINITDFLKGLANVISTAAKQIFEIIINELLNFVLNEIRPLIILFVEKLILERLRFYINLLKRLLALIMMFYRAFKGGPQAKSILDNVNFADIKQDIVPTKETPEITTC